MGGFIFHEVNLELKSAPQHSLFFSATLSRNLCVSNLLACTTSWLNEFRKFPYYLLWDFCLQKMRRLTLRSSLPPATLLPGPDWLSQIPGSPQHRHLLCGLLFPGNWKRQLKGQAMI